MNIAKRPLAHIRRHRLWGAACVALAILLLTSTTFAAQPLTGTFKGKVIGNYVTFTKPNKRTVTDWAGVLNLQLDRDAPGDGLGPLVPVFCIEVNVLVRGGDRYRSDGPVTALHGGCQIRYLLDRYPASTSTTANEAAARQMAIWHFSDDIDLTTIQDAAIQARATALADEATLAVALGGCPGTQATNASLTLSPPTANVVAGQLVNYTVTADPPSAAQSVDIAISGSATLQNGQQQITLPLVQGVATFGVINPIAGTSTITARLPYVLDAGTVFSPINAGHPTQRLVLADRVSLSTSATVQASWGAATPTPTNASPTATPIGSSSTATPLAGSPTATPPIGGGSTATPGTPATSTPSTGGSPTATPLGGLPTPTSEGGAVPTPGSPGGAPMPPTATHKPSSGPKPSPTPASQATPETSPPSGSGSSPSSTPVTGGTGPTGPTPAGGNGAPGGGGPGGTSIPGGTAGGAQASAGGTGGAGGEQIRPSQLPNTGGTGNAAPTALLLAALLIACGLWLRICWKRRA